MCIEVCCKNITFFDSIVCLFRHSHITSYNKFIAKRNLATNLFFFVGIEVRTSKRISLIPIPVYIVNCYIAIYFIPWYDISRV